MIIKIGNRYLQSAEITKNSVTYNLSKTPMNVTIPIQAITHMVNMMAKGHMTKQDIEVKW